MAELTPENRQENWYEGIIVGETTLVPQNRREHWYKGIIDGHTDLTPENRREYWYKAMVESGGGGGGVSVPGLELSVVTIEEDTESLTVPHGLGRVPNLAFAVCSFNGVAWADFRSNHENAILDELLISNPNTQDFDVSYSVNESRNTVDSLTYNSTTQQYALAGTTTYGTKPAEMTAEYVKFNTGRYYGGKFKAGLTYLIIIG